METPLAAFTTSAPVGSEVRFSWIVPHRHRGGGGGSGGLGVFGAPSFPLWSPSPSAVPLPDWVTKTIARAAATPIAVPTEIQSLVFWPRSLEGGVAHAHLARGLVQRRETPGHVRLRR